MQIDWQQHIKWTILYHLKHQIDIFKEKIPFGTLGDPHWNSQFLTSLMGKENCSRTETFDSGGQGSSLILLDQDGHGFGIEADKNTAFVYKNSPIRESVKTKFISSLNFKIKTNKLYVFDNILIQVQNFFFECTMAFQIPFYIDYSMNTLASFFF